MDAGVAPLARMVASTRRAVSRFWGKGMPWLTIVVSSATINFGESPSMGYTVAAGPSADRRITDFVFRISGLPGLQGALYGTALFTTANGQAPNAPYLILVNGGTGPWRGASGILRVVPTSAEGATINVNMLVMAVK